ncbi:uncharacterized protein HMPREF1541_08317 [Cyphellophora europaea CBS 101466]|uniref:Vacuolar ATPase assembly integral membrane protein VMA21 n=1 Tax=Cyphellophora europaea (strain CBS 101466) TaxID=1220924 RepID=W2RLF9_CYPE1|nr:uncharacterized protein HMPREF1541_08317 [Cyphellophora europaea CBS 101466]ETN37326.1 hypothetical protein HMPREF1541_08317 [Cyphellophora europaea CBS 101466]
MASHRGTVSSSLSEKTVTPSQGGADPGPSDTSPAVPADVIYKLLGFTLAMIVFPIGSYFFTLKTVFKAGNATYAGGFAAIMANVVLVGYVIVAMREDQSDKLEAERAKKGKKAQ